jgi:hypothetical protein
MTAPIMISFILVCDAAVCIGCLLELLPIHITDGGCRPSTIKISDFSASCPECNFASGYRDFGEEFRVA